MQMKVTDYFLSVVVVHYTELEGLKSPQNARYLHQNILLATTC
jgi:hypothetical protein